MPIKRSYSEYGDACATAHAMELLGDRWTYPILRELMLAPKRFNEIAEGVHGVTPAVLTTRLRELESSGLVQRVDLPADTRVTAYQISGWGHELQPVLQALGRWARASPVRRTDGCGLTPDAVVQSMLTMAPTGGLAKPAELELRLHDARIAPMQPYVYRLAWSRSLTITREAAPNARAAVAGDSSAWAGVLYDGAPLSVMTLGGDPNEVRRVVRAFAG